MSGKITFQTIKSDALIHYRICKNTDKWVLIIHSPGTNHTQMLVISEFFEKNGFSTIMPDLRGHGKSEYAKCDIKGFAEDIHKVIIKEKIKKICIISYCASGNLALLLVETYPLIFERLTLLTFPNKINLNLKNTIYYYILAQMYFVNKYRKMPNPNKMFDWKNKIFSTTKNHLGHVRSSMDLRYYYSTIFEFTRYKIKESYNNKKISLFRFEIGITDPQFDYNQLAFVSHIINLPRPHLGENYFTENLLYQLFDSIDKGIYNEHLLKNDFLK